MLKIKHSILGFVAFAFTITNAMELKGIEIGAPMAKCPDGSITKIISPIDTTCHLGPTTLGGAEADFHLLHLSNGAVYSVFFSLHSKGPYANGELADALRIKFGQPTRSKSHLNYYIWDVGNQSLVFDGWSGSVLMIDIDVAERVRAEHAKMKKSDL